MYTLKIIPIDDSLGVVLPEEVLVKLGVREGDEIYLTKSPDGWRMSAKGPDGGGSQGSASSNV